MIGTVAEPFRVCFVCTGNICRSPIAEAVVRAALSDAGLAGAVEVDSAGTAGWHVGEPADVRVSRLLAGRGLECAHRARQFDADWFDRYDLVIALDTGHARKLAKLADGQPDAAGKVRLLREFDPAAGGDLDVPDPYYGGTEGFEEVYDLVQAAIPGLIAEIRARLAE
jgi:protein-tyrosine phosphatase